MLLKDKMVFYYDNNENKLIPIPNREKEKRAFLNAFEPKVPSFSSQKDAAKWFEKHFKEKIHLYYVDIFDNGCNNLIYHIILDKNTYPICQQLIENLKTKGEQVDLFLWAKTSFIGVIISENGSIELF